jgi:hypothetical protein
VRDVEQAERDAGLREQHPAAPPPEPAAKQWQRQSIDDGRPEELDRVDDTDPESMPIVARSTPTSRNQADSVENTSMKGSPAEKPRNSIARTRGCRYARNASSQPLHQGLRCAAGSDAAGAGESLTGRGRP